MPKLSAFPGFCYSPYSSLCPRRLSFSDASPLIIFSDHSWLTDRGSYYMPTGEYTSFDGTEPSAEEIERINGVVSNKFTVSAWVLDSDYWRTLFGDNLPPDGE